MLGFACQKSTPKALDTPNTKSQTSTPGFTLNILTEITDPKERDKVEAWVKETISILHSSDFDENLKSISAQYPDVWISRPHDIIPSKRLSDILNTNYLYLPSLWWPESFVTLEGQVPQKDPDMAGHGFLGSRHASTGLHANKINGHIRLGRVHLARYNSNNLVEKSCAINTMAHEISHTLSERKNAFWMLILDSGSENRPPLGVIEASYLIGSVAQCTYLQKENRILESDLHACFKTFSNPDSGSRFRSQACDDFPNQAPIWPDKANLD